MTFLLCKYRRGYDNPWNFVLVTKSRTSYLVCVLFRVLNSSGWMKYTSLDLFLYKNTSVKTMNFPHPNPPPFWSICCFKNFLTKLFRQVKTKTKVKTCMKFNMAENLKWLSESSSRLKNIVKQEITDTQTQLVRLCQMELKGLF